MINFFVYDNVNYKVKLDEYELLLVKEFKDLWDVSRNKCKQDSTGIFRLKANREFSYIYLFFDWKSPYFEYLEYDKQIAVIKDTDMTDDELKDPLFLAACKKYVEIKDSSRILSLIKTAFRTLEKMRIVLDNIDLSERGNDDKPIFKAKDVLADIASIGIMRDRLKELELSYKNEQAKNSKLRGDNEPGFRDA